MLNKIKLFCQIRKFYNIFGEYVGENFITKLSEMTNDNVHDVLFDINEVLEDDHDDMTLWLKKLRRNIRRYNEPKPLTLVDVISTLIAVVLIWGALSTIDISLTDTLLGEQYSPLNLWIIIFGGAN